MKPLLIAFALSRSMDLATTHIALSHGGREVNPLLPQNPTLNLTAGAALTAGQLVVLHRIGRTHPKAARWAIIGQLVLEGWVVSHNLQQGGRP